MRLLYSSQSTSTPPLAAVQLEDFLDELSFLRHRVALLEQALEDARRFANHDEVTGILNRRLLGDRFDQGKARSDRQRRPMAVLFIDVDGFKGVNDACGHAVGDDLLRQIATRLVDCIRSCDTVCRYGGDEFVILLPESDGRKGAISATQKIRDQLGRSVRHWPPRNQSHYLQASAWLYTLTTEANSAA